MVRLKIPAQNKGSWTKMLRIISNWVLCISEDEDSITSPDNLFQYSTSTVKKFFLMFSPPSVMGDIISQYSPSIWSVHRERNDPSNNSPWYAGRLCWPGEQCQTVWVMTPKAADCR